MRAPNPEQLLAIEHTGGVLLSAGAGSGKTFVIIEHLIYLIKNYINQEDDNIDAEWIARLEQYLDGIVVMTFTKKAASEIMLRFKSRVSGEFPDSSALHVAINQSVDHLFVGTIHGFCSKLLSGGYLPQATPQISITSEQEFKKKLGMIVDSWLEYSQERNDHQGDSDLYNSFLDRRRELVGALKKIFERAELRFAWEESAGCELSSFNHKEYFWELWTLLGCENLVSMPINIENDYHDYHSKKWYQLIAEFNQLRQQIVYPSDANDLKLTVEFFKRHKGVRSPLKRLGLGEIDSFFDQYKIFKGKFARVCDDLIAFFERRDQFNSWQAKFHQLVKFAKREYAHAQLLTFSDLEYLVSAALKSDEVATRIGHQFNYFIIDEFQDTSPVQFEIVRAITGGDLNKIFGVGDIKQAIYGFRGGELAVFQQCQKLIANNLSLANNYRSAPQVTNFNNLLFANLLPLGEGFCGTDSFAVDFDSQCSPDQLSEHDSEQKIFVRPCEIEEREDLSRLSSSQMDRYEADAIFDQILTLLNRCSRGEKIAVLYLKLAPSRHLISRLIDQQTPFIAQVKIPFKDDPLIGIFQQLVDIGCELESEMPQKNYSVLVISAYLEILGIPIPDQLRQMIDDFFLQTRVSGIYHSFQKMLFVAGISSANYRNNMEHLESICQMEGDNYQALSYQLTSGQDRETYSYDFHFGNEPRSVVIMTVHSSKGLEFDNVILGGIHTNGRAMADGGTMGTIPASFKWKAGVGSKLIFRSPYYLLESILNGKKSFSEKKRLLYVACTRAVSSLSWIDIKLGTKPQSSGKNSWINGLRTVTGQFSSECRIEYENIEGKDYSCSELSPQALTKSSLPPIFHLDPLGIGWRMIEDAEVMVAIPELSVTRLLSLAECPHKFYLQNICRLEEEDTEQLEEIIAPNKRSSEKNSSGASPSDGVSSALRGTRLHDLLASYALREEPDLSTQNAVDYKALEWASKIIASCWDRSEMIIERGRTFHLFDYMISGTPDMIILSSDGCQIWDYKTGSCTPERQEIYIFQLQLYAFALYTSGETKIADQITLKIIYLDQQTVYDHQCDYPGICKALGRVWSNLNCLYLKNASHCHICRFRNICTPGI